MTPAEKPDKQRDHSSGEIADRSTEAWSDRCGRLFEEMRRPARAMIARAYGRALSDDEIEDVYSAAWAATLAALRERGRRMQESELRAYILTAVASHASKEMRRRTRKPLKPLEAEREQTAVDDHMPLPDELAIGSEARGVARDLLTSLPVRRRAVMLLRYGWGLSPQEVCALVPGLSPRAYRKEVTRGVEDLIEGLGKVEKGEWCRDRAPLIRDLIAGTADESTRRQALEHLKHCRPCADLATRLSHDLHEVGSIVALATVAGCIGGPGFPVLQGLSDLVAGLRTAAANVVEKVEANATALLTSGGAKGSGAAGAGAVAKLAGAGGAAKAAVACVGAGAAATACVAAGVVSGVPLPDLDLPNERRTATARMSRVSMPIVTPRRAIASVIDVSRAVEHERQDGHASTAAPPPADSTPPTGSSGLVEQPATPSPVQEFDPVAAAAPAPTPTPTDSVPSETSSSGGAASATSVAQNEFGP